MSKLIIQKTKSLNGSVLISGSKNASLPIIAACLLSDEWILLKNVPQLTDVEILLSTIIDAGCIVHRMGSTVAIKSRKDLNYEFTDEKLNDMRAGILLCGPILSKCSQFKVRVPGGCAIGSRPYEQHLNFFKAIGAQIENDDEFIICRSVNRKKIVNFSFDVITVTGTENAILASVIGGGEVCITNAAREPEVVELARMLNQFGAQIEGAGTSCIKIKSTKKLAGGIYEISGDRIEFGTYAASVIGVGGSVELMNAKYHDVLNIVRLMRRISPESDFKWGKNSLKIKSKGKNKGVKFETNAYPGIPTDVQPIFVPLLTVASGYSEIKENIYENRFTYSSALNSMGAKTNVQGNTLFIEGVYSITGKVVYPMDLRASAGLVIAGLLAEGVTEVKNLTYLDRGYEYFVEKFQSLNASITRVNNV